MKENVEQKEKKKVSILNILLIFIMVVVTLIGVFFLSTYIRWKSEINNKTEILYYKQDNIKIDNLKDFYGSEISYDIEDTEAILMYCSHSYGGECVTGDFSNTLENLFRNPYIVINIVILVDLLLLYIIMRNNNVGLIKLYIIGALLLLYGVYGIGRQVYKYADYYKLVNDSEYVVDGLIYKGVMTENTSKFKPVVSYETEKGEFIKYLDYNVVDSKVGDKITLYYDKKDNEIVTPRRTIKEHIIYIVVAVLTVLESILYFVKAKKTKNKENS